MHRFDGVDDLEAAVGRHLGRSDWHRVTQLEIDLFADATGDHQWIHVDPQRAQDGPFGTTIAHGYLTLSLIPRLVGQVYTVQGVPMAVNYGSDKVRFPAPVPVGSRVRAGVELLGVRRGPAGTYVTTRVTVELEGSPKPACVADVISLLGA